MTAAPAGVLEAYFDQAASLFDRAVGVAGRGPDRSVDIAGHAAALRFAGPALARGILPALSHLGDAGRAGLIIRLWDLKSTGVLLPPPPWDALAYRERGNTRAFHDTRFSLSYDRRTDVFSAVDLAQDRAVYWTRDAEALPNYTSAAPMHRLLQGWLQSKGLFVVHAAALGRSDAGLLLAGRSGSGKSTTAALSLGYDLLHAGDDFALVQGEPEPYVHTLYSTTKVNRDTLARLSWLQAAVSNPDALPGEKALVFLGAAVPARVARGFPLRAVVLPRVTRNPESTAVRVSSLDAYRLLAPDTAFTMLGDAHVALRRLRALIDRLPCYSLALGTDPGGIARALGQLLQHGDV
jgi:hypothetical protein